MTILLSILSIAMIYAMGCKWKYAPVLGIIAQVFWIIFVLMTKQYGLLIGVVGYLIVHIINLFKWLDIGRKVKKTINQITCEHNFVFHSEGFDMCTKCGKSRFTGYCDL